MNLTLQKNIKNIDDKYYAVLGAFLNFVEEDELIYNNITISPLIFDSGNKYHIKLSFFSEDAYKKFFTFMSKKIASNFSIDGLPFIFTGFTLSEKGQIYDFNKELDNKDKSYKGIKIKFITPTVIKSSGVFKLLPLSSVYLYSMIQKYENILGEDKFFELFGFKCSLKIKNLLEDGFFESGYNLTIKKVFIKGGYIPGNIGEISFSLNNKFDDDVFKNFKKFIPVFINGIRRTGLGYGTRLGLGQVEGEIY